MSSNSTFFGILCSYWKSRTPAERFIRNINGGWYGRVVYSPTSNVFDADYHRINVTFNTEESRGFSSVAVVSPDNSIDSQYFFKIEDNSQSELSITNRFDEEVALFKLNYTNDAFTIRGRLIPSNDQLTGLFKGRNIMFTITDQFTDNITTILLESVNSDNIFHYYYHIFLYIMVLVAISAGLYKMSDLSDIIKPDEAKYTQMVKLQAQREAKIKEARELLKKMEDEEAKLKAQEEEGKIKTE